MAKGRDRRRNHKLRLIEENIVIPFHKKFEDERRLPPIIAKNKTQALYLGYLRTAAQIMVLGPAGTGKTWMAATYAADLYRAKSIRKIILTRPNVPCGRSLGFFPGSMDEKMAPWAAPVTQALRDRLGDGVFDIALRRGDIEIVPFEVMRGRSWRDAFILLDEAQNTSISEMKMFLTRIGEDCITVINGDIEQCDLNDTSGLKKALDLITQYNLPVPIVEFNMDDIVRSGQCAMWVRAFGGVPQKPVEAEDACAKDAAVM
jgi:phosphate starvation-inducible protein PhoH and related proteins